MTYNVNSYGVTVSCNCGNCGSSTAAEARSRAGGYAYGYSNLLGSRTVRTTPGGSQQLLWQGPSGSVGYNDAVLNANSLNNGGGLISNKSNNATNPSGIYLGSVGQVTIAGVTRMIATPCGSCFGDKAIIQMKSPAVVIRFLATAVKNGIRSLSYTRPTLSDKIIKQMDTRGWTKEAIDDAILSGQQFRAVVKSTGNPATRYVNPNTGLSVVVDDITNAVIQVGRADFKW